MVQLPSLLLANDGVCVLSGWLLHISELVTSEYTGGR